MGLFNDLGRRVERFKQSAVEAADADADYECRACEARFHTDREECPECGSPEVVPTADEERGGSADEDEHDGSADDEDERNRSTAGEGEQDRPADAGE